MRSTSLPLLLVEARFSGNMNSNTHINIYWIVRPDNLFFHMYAATPAELCDTSNFFVSNTGGGAVLSE